MSVLTLADAKTHLNITGSTNDTELQAFIDAAEAAIGKRVGPLTSTSVTARVDGCAPALVLPTAPAISLTSVTPVGGSALTLADLYLDTETAVIQWNRYGWFTADRYDVVYAAGRSTVPLDLLQAVKEMVRYLWDTQRGNAPASSGILPDSEPAFDPTSNASLWWRVEQLIAPHRNAGIL